MEKFKAIYFDISGTCNANCPFCMTGPGKLRVKKFISPDMFEKAVIKLKEVGALNTETILSLYNWGEPFMHPDIDKIVDVLNRQAVKFALGTNASLYHKIYPGFVKNLSHLIFSMSGFSQKSYDRIHGFKFERIKKNIENFVDEARSSGFEGSFSLFFHVYQFNVKEIPVAKRFADSLDINFNPYLAIVNEWDKMNQMIDGTLSYSDLLSFSKSLFLYNFDELVQSSPEDYKCPQWDYLTIDEDCNVLLCCQTPKYANTYMAGNLLSDDFNEILLKRKSSSVCNNCLNKGLAYYINNSLEQFNIEDFQIPQIEDKVLKFREKSSVFSGPLSALKSVMQKK